MDVSRWTDNKITGGAPLWCTSYPAPKALGLSSRLTLKTTAKYMMTVNVDTRNGLVNGAPGELMQVDTMPTSSGNDYVNEEHAIALGITASVFQAELYAIQICADNLAAMS